MRVLHTELRDRRSAWRLKSGKKSGKITLEEAKAIAARVGLPVPGDFDLLDVLLAGVFLAAVLVLALPDCLLDELVDLLAALLLVEPFDLVVLAVLADEADLLVPLLGDAL